MLAAGSRVAHFDHRLEFVAVAFFLFLDGDLVEFELAGAGLRLEQAGAAHAAFGDIEALDVSRTAEGGEGAANRHRVAHIGGLGDFLEGFVDLEFLVALIEQVTVNRADYRSGGVGAIDEKFLRAGVGIIEKQLAGGSLAIASGASGFLVVGLDAAGDFVMDHEAHIRAVDAHAECIGGDRDVGLAANELFLRLFAFLVAHATVICDAFESPAGDGFGNRLDLFARRAIDDAGFVGGDD